MRGQATKRRANTKVRGTSKGPQKKGMTPMDMKKNIKRKDMPKKATMRPPRAWWS